MDVALINLFARESICSINFMNSDSCVVDLFGPLERHSLRRADAKWLHETKQNPESRFVVIHEDRFLASIPVKSDECSFQPLFLHGKTLRRGVEDSLNLSESIYLGDRAGTAFFALSVSKAVASQLIEVFGSQWDFVDLRSHLPVMRETDANVVALGRFLLNWNRRNRYCGVCGAKTEKLQDGHARKCVGESCGEEFYASMDPAIIVLVRHGDRALLGRAKNWRSGLYSTLAGFVEPGETLEQAVRREVFEESGIRVSDVTYQSSQPWLFPASLMLGFTALATNDEITMDPDEMDDVKWFTREALLANPEAFPSKASIAHRLIQSWLYPTP